MKEIKMTKKKFAIMMIAILLINNFIMQVFVIPRVEKKANAEELVMDEASEETIDAETDEDIFYEEASEEESVELSGEDEEITEETGVSEEDSAPFEEVEEVMEEDALGVSDANSLCDAAGYIGKYDSVSVGQVLEVVVNTDYPEGGYMESEDAWFGMVNVPKFEQGWDSKTATRQTALVKIPKIRKPEKGRTYEGIFLMDTATKIGYGDYPDVLKISIVNDRVYIQPLWNTVSKTNSKKNVCEMFLLYSINANGGDLRLNARSCNWDYDNTDLNRAAALENYRYFVYQDGLWGIGRLANITDTSLTQYHTLKSLNIEYSYEGLSGFLSPGDKYFNLDNETRKYYSEEIGRAAEEWCAQNGYRKSVVVDPSTIKVDDQGNPSELAEARLEYAENETVNQMNKSVSANIIVLPKCTVDVSTYFTTGENKGKNVKYVSSDKKLASVKKNGIVTGKKPGKVKITRRVKSGKTWKDAGYIEVTVYKPDVKVSTKNPMAVRLDYDKTYDMSELVTNKSDVKAVYSAKGSAISMNPDGTFKVLSEGKAKVTIAFGKYKVKAKVVVTP